MAEAKKAKSAKADAKAKKAVKEAELTAEAVAEEAVPEAQIEVTEDKPTVTAKAGKRSAKAIAEAEEKKEKRDKKAQAPEKTEAKPAKKPTRPKVERAGKKFREAAKLVDKNKVYSLTEALELIVKTSPTKFDATVELHANLGVDPRQADQNVRGTVVLPAGTGKQTRIAVFAEADDAKAAKAAGADIAGADEVLALLDKEQLDFEVLIATPNMMPRLGKYARLLGPRGLMPNPKSGTVSADTAKAVSEAKAGRVEYRVDQAGIIHLGIGKVSFGRQKLEDNASAILASIRAAKPGSLKGVYLKSAYITTTMGPSVKLEV